jgi:NADH-quinone oxidoreductase subunit H
MADETLLSSRAHAASCSALGAGAVVVLSLVPAGEAPLAPRLSLALLIAISALAAVALSLAAVGAAVRPRARAAVLVRGAALWAATGLTMLTAAAAVAATAQSLDLANIVRAQANSTLYLLRQPAAASLYVMGFVLAADESVLRAVLGAKTRSRRAAEAVLLAAVAALGATLFLGGWLGSGLPDAAWVAVKTLAVAVLLVLLRGRFASLAPASRLAIAWGAAMAGFVNLAVTLILVAT